jgi:hypothetical protein
MDFSSRKVPLVRMEDWDFTQSSFELEIGVHHANPQHLLSDSNLLSILHGSLIAVSLILVGNPFVVRNTLNSRINWCFLMAALLVTCLHSVLRQHPEGNRKFCLRADLLQLYFF